MKSFVDRKRAASGERDEDEGMVLAPTHSLLAALKAPRTERRSLSPSNPVTEPLMAFKDRRGQGSYIEAPGSSLLTRVNRELPAALAKDKSFHLNDERELVVELGPIDRQDGRQMVVADVEWGDLVKDPMLVVDSMKTLEKHHPMVYSLHLDRSELSSNTVVFEMGIYSRVIGQEHKDYIGKTKVFFPRPNSKMTLFINLSKIQ